MKRNPGSRFWVPTTDANCVQIGSWVTYRKDGEQLAELLDRAIREYPDRSAQLVFLGWRESTVGQ
jgi:hypothetical protein